MKKGMALLLSLILVISVIGCSKKTETDNSGSAQSSSESKDTNKDTVKDNSSKDSAQASTKQGKNYDVEMELTFLTHKQGMEDTFAEYQAEFNKIYPNVKITYEPIADYKSNIEMRWTSNDWGDMCMVPHQFISETELPNLFASLGSVDDYSSKYEFASAFSLDGQVYGISSTGTAYGVLWNKAVLEKAGVTEFPKTSDEFFAVLEKVKANTDAIPCYCNYGAGSRLADWEWNARGSMTGDGNYKNKMIYMVDPFAAGTPYNTVMRMLYDVVARDLVEDDPTTSTWDSCKNLLATGQVACTVIGSWACQDTKNVSETPDDIVFTAFPCNINGQQYATVAADYAYAINKNITEDRYQVCLDYITWLTEKSGFSYSTGGIPIMKGEEYPATLKNLQDNNVILVVDNAPNAEDVGLFDEISTDSEVYLGKYYEKARLVESAMGQSTETFEEIMDDWNKRWTESQKRILGDDYAGKGKY